MRFVPHFILACCLFVVSPLHAQPSIDGFIDDDFWTTQARVWHVEKDGDDQQATRFWLGHDNEYLYFAADVKDVDVRGKHTGRKAEVWKDDAVELFIDFGDGTAEDRTPQTFEYGFSAAGGVNWTRGTGTGDGQNFPGHDWPPRWDSQVQWSTRAKSGTTLNFNADTDRGYVVEARIPWAELQQSPPFENEKRIGINFLNVLHPGPQQDQPGLLCSTPGITFANNHQPKLWQRIRLNWMGPLPVRGLVEDLPLWLDTNADHGDWKQYQSAQSDEQGPWLNRRYWTRLFEQMNRMKFNTLLLKHPHPFNGFLALENFPDAAHFTGPQLDRHAEQLHWLLDRAEKQGLNVYLSCRNIHLPETWSQKQGTEGNGVDNPVVQKYMREAVGQLLEKYPKLTGLVVTNENPTGCVNFVLDTIVKGLAKTSGTNNKPKLLLHTRGLSPEQAARIIEAWPNTQLLHDLQGQQWFTPTVDPRLQRYENKVRALIAGKDITVQPTIALGGPQSASRNIFWGDPEWMRKLNLDLRRQGCGGMFLKTENALPWVCREAMGKYAYDAGDAFDKRFWEQRLNAVYGSGKHSGQLLEAMQQASAIMPELLKLVHSQSQRFTPQFGLLMVQYMGLPTISGYVSCRDQQINEEGYLDPLLGSTWPNPDWGSPVASVEASLEYGGPAGEVEADKIANNIRQSVSGCQSRLTSLRHVQPPNKNQQEQWSILLDHLAMNAALGEHYAWKIKGALGWAEYKALRGRTSGIYHPLQQSIEAWETVCKLADKLYDNELPFWQQQPYSPPPWSADQIFESYQPVKGHWRDQLILFKRELMRIRESVGMYNTDAPLPLWDQLTATSQKDLQTVHMIHFEKDRDKRYQLNFAQWIEQPSQAIHGMGAILIDTREQGEGWHTVLSIDPTYAPMLAYRQYQISLSYYVVEANQNKGAIFGVALQSSEEQETAMPRLRWRAPKDYLGIRFLQTPVLENDRTAFYLEVKGPAVLVVDDLEISLLSQP